MQWKVQGNRVELNRITNFQSDQGDGRGINTDASWLNQSGGGRTGFVTNRL